MKYVEAMLRTLAPVDLSGMTIDAGNQLDVLPVGQTVPLRHQLKMAGFLPADEVAIVKLSDLKVLIEAAGVTARAQ